MPRLAPIDPATANGRAKTLLEAVKSKLGITPNMMRTMANAPSVLEGYLNFGEALSHGTLGPKVREAIALAAAQSSECDYCLSAHTVLGKMAGLSPADTDAARRFESSDKQAAAALTFARAVIRSHGSVTEADVAAVRSAGFTDGQIAEVIANVGFNYFTNTFNKVANTEIDFPHVSPRARAA